ncbi:hypothetical protein ACFQ60_24840 [Streptomyces zhihengii]
MLAETLRGAFAPLAADRPTAARLLDLLAPGAARRIELTVPADETGRHGEAFEQALHLKRQAPPTEPSYTAGLGQGEVLCPYCLENIQLDLTSLYVTDNRMQYQPLDPPATSRAPRG